MIENAVTEDNIMLPPQGHAFPERERDAAHICKHALWICTTCWGEYYATVFDPRLREGIAFK